MRWIEYAYIGIRPLLHLAHRNSPLPQDTIRSRPNHGSTQSCGFIICPSEMRDFSNQTWSVIPCADVLCPEVRMARWKRPRCSYLNRVTGGSIHKPFDAKNDTGMISGLPCIECSVEDVWLRMVPTGLRDEYAQLTSARA
jgi:hypothetical protein